MKTGKQLGGSRTRIRPTRVIRVITVPRRDAVAAEEPRAAQALGWGVGGSGYRAAEWSPGRSNYLTLPEIATGGPQNPDIDSYSLNTLRRMSDSFHKNSGFVRRLFNGTARYAIGRGLVPYATTRDRKWNQAAEEYFDMWARDRQRFDVAGRYNFYAAQRMQARGMFRLGASLGLRTKSLDGASPMMQFFEPQRVGGQVYGQDGWDNGIQISARGRTMAYRFLKVGGDDGEAERVESAARVSHLYDPERGCQVHGRPWLSFGLHKLADCEEIEAAATAGVKLDQVLGLVRTSAAQDGPPAFGAESTVTAPGPGDVDQTVRQEDIFGAGAILSLRQGEKVESFRSEKPSERLEAWLAYHLRNLCWGFGTSPELAWNIAGVGGAPMRWILQDGQLFFEEVQNLLCERALREAWAYRIAWGVSTGELGLPEGDRPWWRAPGWIAPQKVTVDIGRDGKLSIDLIGNGLLSIPRYYRALGLDWQEELGAQMDALEWVKSECERRGTIEPREVMAALPEIGGAAFGGEAPGDPDE